MRMDRCRSELAWESVGAGVGERTRSWGREMENCGGEGVGRMMQFGDVDLKESSTTTTTMCGKSKMDEVEDISFPSYDDVECGLQAMASSTRSISTRHYYSKDDSSLLLQPTTHVDYLSHDWTHEDLLATWKYVSSTNPTDRNSPRLKNAVWRSWRKIVFNLETVDAEGVGWSKDCDVLWLYGPFQQDSSCSSNRKLSPRPNPSLSSSLKRTCLKQRTASEIMLSASQFNASSLRHSTKDCSVNLLTSLSERQVITPQPRTSRSVRFCDQVQRCITVENDNDIDVETQAPLSCAERKLIAPLPSTTLSEESEKCKTKTVSTETSTGLSPYLQLTHISSSFSEDFILTDEDEAEFDWLSFEDSDYLSTSTESLLSSDSSASNSSSSTPSSAIITPVSTSPLPLPSTITSSKSTSSSNLTTTSTKDCTRCHLPMRTNLTTQDHVPSPLPLDICSECIRSILEDTDFDAEDSEEIGFDDGVSSRTPLPTFNPLLSTTPRAVQATTLTVRSMPLQSSSPRLQISSPPYSLPHSVSAPTLTSNLTTSPSPPVLITSLASFPPFQPLAYSPNSWTQVPMTRIPSDEGYGSEEVGDGNDETKCDCGWDCIGLEGCAEIDPQYDTSESNPRKMDRDSSSPKGIFNGWKMESGGDGQGDGLLTKQSPSRPSNLNTSIEFKWAGNGGLGGEIAAVDDVLDEEELCWGMGGW